MKGIEQGRLTAEYPVIISPYREAIQQMARTEDGDGLQTFIDHDYANFRFEFSFLFAGTPLKRSFSGRLTDVREHLLTDLDTHLPPGGLTLNPFTNKFIMRRYGNLLGVVPNVRDYAEAIFDSSYYLESLNVGDQAEEERRLLQLAQRKVPIAPLCAYYKSDLLVDGNRYSGEDTSLGGLQFISFYNLLTNARHHSVPAIEGETPVVEVNFSTESGRVEIMNFSEEFVLENSIQFLVDNDHYGLLISSLYAALGGLPLGFNSKRDGTFIISESTNQIAPRYKVSVSLG